jgi:hypothetical protein
MNGRAAAARHLSSSGAATVAAARPLCALTEAKARQAQSMMKSNAAPAGA